MALLCTQFPIDFFQKIPMIKLRLNYMITKEKLPLIVGIGLPLLLILYVAITASLPSLFVKPKYNFIYVNDPYHNRFNINVLNGKINMEQTYRYDNRYDNSTFTQPTLFLYDVINDKSTQISLAQAQSYTLDPSNKSPDGFTVGRRDSDSSSYFPFFFGSYDTGNYLMGKGLNRRITEGNYYNFKFAGWIVNE